MPTERPAGSPFCGYTVPGLILGGAYAPASLLAALAVWRRGRRARGLALAAGGVPVGWIVTQVSIVGYMSFLQPLMLAVGPTDLGLAWRAHRRRR
ncbi:MAG TPA: hypothetical protein VN213_09555 [Solirubrobacteraceae bacterium]|nr:hypothetical protein [Solirubrobacteraceae bacterium]